MEKISKEQIVLKVNDIVNKYTKKETIYKHIKKLGDAINWSEKSSVGVGCSFDDMGLYIDIFSNTDGSTIEYI